MHRRKFLGTVALGAGATALPVWLSRAFRLDEPRVCEDPVTVDLGDIPVQMTDPDRCLPGDPRTSGKPQLVLVIPTDQGEKFRRGHAFGELLNHGSDEQLAPLACFELICRSLADLGPTWIVGAPLVEPLMVLLDTDGQLRALDGVLAQDPNNSLDDNRRATEACIDARIALLADLVASAADGTRLAAQACSERASLPANELRRLDELPTSLGELQPADVDRAPATTMLLARTGEPEVRTHLTALLAAAVRARVGQRQLGGVPWARTTGCGSVVEGASRNAGFACGMGNVPRRSQRFLQFYVEPY